MVVLQRWLSGLRRTTGNRVYLVRVPRVQIPLSAVNKNSHVGRVVAVFVDGIAD